MKKSPFILRSSIFIACSVGLAAPLLQAATVDTFSPGGTLATPTQLGAGPGPAIVLDTDGVNNILRLLDGQNSQNNHYTYDNTDVGAFETINASFDFRIGFGSNGLADGLGFILIPTANFGISGDGPNPTAEEPNVAGAFGLGIDVYPGINNISTHWNGFQVSELNPAFVASFRDNTVFNRVQITLQRVGNATNATVTLTADSLGAVPGTPTKIMETVIPNMLPYENRVHFGARTGGENLRLDLDNINVAYTNPFVAVLPDAPTGHLYQDFDSAGTTAYRAITAAQPDATTFRPGPLIKAAEPGSSGSFLRIANDNVAGQNNRIIFNRAIDGGATNMTEVLQMDIRFNSADAPADGLGLLFVPTRDPSSGASNLNTDGIASSEEPNHPNMLGIGFDVYNNGAPDVAPGVSLHFNSTKLADVALPPELGINQFHRVQVTREPVVGGLNVSVSAIPDINGVPGAPVTLIDRVFVAGANATNYDYRLQLSGRTGGANADHDVDNIVTSQLARPLLANTQADFSPGSGSGWKGYMFNVGAGPQLRNDGELNGHFLRITHDGVNGQTNAVTFDKQLDGTIGGATGIKATVDFRMASGADQPADGLSFMIIPTTTYGNTGAGAAATPGFIAEEPNVAGVFGVGFDIYEPGGPSNEASIHWDGGQFSSVNLDPLQIDLDSGAFHRMQLELTADPLGVLVDLILTPNIFGFAGTPVVVADDFLITGMTLSDYRVELAARTGGLDMNVDIDNLLVQTIPEPSGAALLGLGALLLARRRRRS